MNPAHDKPLRPFAVLLSAALLLSAPLFAADPPSAQEPVELKTLRMEYQQRLMKAQTPADDWYRMQLRTLLARYKQSGNLDAAVTAQAEMENPDPSTPVPADKPLPPDLAGLRNTYVVNARRMTQPVDGWYKQQLEALERALVQRGDLVGAQAVRGLMGRQDAASAPAPASGPVSPAGGAVGWKTPLGGKFKGDARTAELNGPGSGFGNLELAAAFQDREMSRESPITGRIRITGNAGGFALGRDEKDCLTVYWSRGSSWAVQHHGAERKVLGQPALAWKPDSWQDFELRREGSQLSVKLDRSSASIKIPKGIGKWYFGLMTGYKPSGVEIRNLETAAPLTGVRP